MANLPADLIDEANRVITRAMAMEDIPEREAILRSAVHLAYYATYHFGSGRAAADGMLIEDKPAGLGSHETLWRWWFGQMAGRSDIARAGTELKDLRVLADYRLRRTLTMAAATRAVTEAERLIGLLRT